MKYIALMTDNGSIKGNIRFYCEILEVSRQGFYDYLERKEKPWKHERLAEHLGWVRLKFAAMNLKKYAIWKWSTGNTGGNDYFCLFFCSFYQISL